MNNLDIRAEQLLRRQKEEIYKRTDRLFASLLFFEWIALIAVAEIGSPKTWTATASSIHPHVWQAAFLGGTAISLPLILVKLKPGQPVTRHLVAIGQMLLASLLIHLTGGRIESHFHIFGSLAFLAFYRDWRVLITASLVAALDHLLRGMFFPLSVYGIPYATPWRTVEHVFWVVFQDVFLVRACVQSSKEMRIIAVRQATIEEGKSNVESLVKDRTNKLQISERQLSAQYEVARILMEANSLHECVPTLLKCISGCLLTESPAIFCAMWLREESHNVLYCADTWSPTVTTEPYKLASQNLTIRSEVGLPGRVWASGSMQSCRDVSAETSFIRNKAAIAAGLKTGIAFPIMVDGIIHSVVEIYSDEIIEISKEITDLLTAVGRQISQFVSNKISHETNEQLGHLVEFSSDAIFGISLELNITSWNRGAEKMYGYTASQVLGQNVKMLVPDYKFAELETNLEKVKSGLSIDGLDTLRKRTDGVFDVSLSLSPIYKDAEVIGVSEIDRDITERKAAEKRVSEFYSIVSHELRTPLTSIRGALGLIEAGIVKPNSERCQELIKIGRISADRLIRLINDILDLKKIESGKFDLHLEPIAADALLSEAVNSLMGMANERGVKLFLAEDSPRVQVNVDKDRCAQVLANLISNALKFSPDGAEVHVQGTITEDEQLRFSVIDNGPGIPEAELPLLFQKFRQLDSSDARKTDGTGLGLAVSKALVQELGGHIGVNSKPGIGSTFWFELPLASKRI